MKKILVIGSLNIDFSLDVEKIPMPGETVNAKSININNGGKGANQAYTIAKLGGNVSMLGMIGNDEYGKKLKNSLKDVGVNVKNIKLNKKGETGKAFINVADTGENAITIVHGCNYDIDINFIDNNKKLIENADIILMQLEIPIETVEYILKIAKDKTIILDPAPANKKIMEMDLKNVFLMKPNETELSTLTNIQIDSDESIEKAATMLIDKGVKNVVVSLGDKGSYLFSQSTSKFFPCIKKKTVDTTAAGDSFIASIAFGLSNNKNIDECIELATKVASIVVTRKGAQSSIPSIKEVI
ncbi:MAG: ribokinase [Bacilli bacterium]